MLNVKYWRIFCDVISLLDQVYIVSVDRAYKEVYTKKYGTFSMAQFLWYDCTFKTFGTLIENMSRTGLYDCYIF